MPEWIASEMIAREPTANPTESFIRTRVMLERTERRAVFCFSSSAERFCTFRVRENNSGMLVRILGGMGKKAYAARAGVKNTGNAGSSPGELFLQHRICHPGTGVTAKTIEKRKTGSGRCPVLDHLEGFESLFPDRDIIIGEQAGKMIHRFLVADLAEQEGRPLPDIALIVL